ncbi:MAG TPA: ABC transporter permease [Candidatus Angelobacter sp.]|nr:ABC transporter permease [Candidatus Angelobacter sp.]
MVVFTYSRFSIMNILRSLRVFRRSPVFALSVICTLAVGIGTSTAMFTATYDLLLKPLPYPDRRQLVALKELNNQKAQYPVSLDNFTDWQSQSNSYESMAAYRPRSFGFRADADIPGPLVPISVGMVTSDFFQVLKKEPVLGRMFTRDEETKGEPLIVITQQLWQQRLGGRRDILGKKVELNGGPYIVIGILPHNFTFNMDGKVPDGYISINHKDYGNGRTKRGLGAIARLKPDKTLQDAQTELNGITGRLAAAYPEDAHWSGEVQDLQAALRGKNREAVTLLMAAGLMFLLIACSNTAGIVFARLLSRTGEIATRISLGASVWTLTRQFLSESFILALLGTVCGLSLSQFCMAIIPPLVPLLGGAKLSPSQLQDLSQSGYAAFWYAGLLCIAITLLFAMLPIALRQRASIQSMLKANQATASSRNWLRNILVAGQAALSVAMLLAAGLFLRSFSEMLAIDPGFHSGKVATFVLGLPGKKYDTDAKVAHFHEQLLQQLDGLPGIDEVGATSHTPLTGPGPRAGFAVEGEASSPDRRYAAQVSLVSPGYFNVMSIPVLEGRAFTLRDNLERSRVLIVNRSLVNSYFANQSALGKRITLTWASDANPTGTVWEIVGVTRDIHSSSLDQPSAPEIFLSLSQFPDESAAYMLRTERADTGLNVQVSKVVQDLDPELEAVNVHPLSDVLSASVSQRRLSAILSALFSAAALFLTAIGIYGIVAFTIEQRKRELAIRIALGASRHDIVLVVARYLLRIVMVGVGAGILLFWGSHKLIQQQLYGVHLLDPATFIVAIGTLLLVAAFAASFPVMGLSRISPLSVMRSE